MKDNLPPEEELRFDPAVYTILRPSMFGFLGSKIPSSFRLLADDLRLGPFSIHLGNNRWESKALRLFNTSLSMTQKNVVDIGRGTFSDRPSYRVTTPRPEGATSSSVKVPVIGWKNINVTEISCVVFSLMLLWITTIKLGEHILLVRLFTTLRELCTQPF